MTPESGSMKFMALIADDKFDVLNFLDYLISQLDSSDTKFNSFNCNSLSLMQIILVES